jgi:hypothetical protein
MGNFNSIGTFSYNCNETNMRFDLTEGKFSNDFTSAPTSSSMVLGVLPCIIMRLSLICFVFTKKNERKEYL